MKKSLIAIAVAAALPAFAQAQTNVTLYGIMDLGVGYKDQGGSSDGVMVVDPGYQSTNRFGIKGSEDLGGGLKAIFNIEAGLNTDTGDQQSSPGLFQRRSIVGLEGGWGSVRLGRDYTSGFSAAGTTDIMGYSFFGNWLNFTAGVTAGTGAEGVSGIETRHSNAIHYTSPAFGNTKCMASTPSTECGAFSGGLTFSGFYGAPEKTNGSNAGEGYGAAVVYKGGPLILQGYWQTLTTTAKNLGITNDTDVDQYGLGAAWNFGMFRIAGNMGEADIKLPSAKVKNMAWALGGAMKLGGGEIMLNFVNRELKNLDQTSLAPFYGEKPKATTWGLAYTYPLSKRTNVYATFGQTNNNSTGAFPLVYSQASYNAGGDGGTLSDWQGSDVMGFAVGVRHLF